MTKRLKIISIFFIGLLKINAQEIKPTYTISNENVGFKIGKIDSIKGNFYNFDYDVFDYSLDSNMKNLFLVIRKTKENYYKNKGYAALLDLGTNKFVWKKKINAFDLVDAKDALILSDGKFINYHHKSNGKLIWYIEDQNFYFNKPNNLFFNREISAFDANTGVLKWNRNSDNNFGWNDSKFINDSLFVWASSGLHLANFKTGLGWDYKLVSGYSKPKMNAASNAAAIAGGVALGLLTGFYVVPGGGENIIHGLSSNIAHTDSCIYYAASNKIISLKIDGNMNWFSELKADSCGASKLILFKNYVLLLNTGYAYKNNQKINYGTANITLFDKRSGNKIYKKYLNTNQFIDVLILRNNWLYYIVGNTLVKFDIEKGALVGEFILDESKEIKNWFFVNNDAIYVSEKTNENVFKKLDSVQIVVSSKEGKLKVITPNMDVSEIIDSENIFLNESVYKNNPIISKGEKTLLLSSTNSKLAEFNYYNPRLIGNLICFKKRNKLITIDLDRIISN